MADQNDAITQPTVTPEQAEEQAAIMAEGHPDQAADTTPAAESTNSEPQGEATTADETPAAQKPEDDRIPAFRAGDTLRLGVRIKEGEKARIQYFEGIVLSHRGMGASQSFTIRKIAAGGIAVERIFPLYSPTLASIEVRRRGIVRRAKIYFLRDIVGSTANVIKERKISRKAAEAAKAAQAAKK